MNSVAPGSGARIGNEYYADDEEFVFAVRRRACARSTRRSSTPA